MKYMETSAKTMMNVNEVFNALVENVHNMMKNSPMSPDKDHNPLKIFVEEETKSGCC